MTEEKQIDDIFEQLWNETGKRNNYTITFSPDCVPLAALPRDKFNFLPLINAGITRVSVSNGEFCYYKPKECTLSDEEIEQMFEEAIIE